MKMVRLSILIPAYNEERTIEKLINKVKSVDFLSLGILPEIIVINDCSKDSTLNILKNIEGIKVISHTKNKGKGGAVKSGIKYCQGDIVIIQDADMEYDPNEILDVVTPILERKAKVVYGSRFLSKNQKERNKFFMKHNRAYLLAYIGGRAITLLTNILYFSKLTDEPTCYKCFDARVIKNIKIYNDRFEWEPEVTAKILKKGIKIREVPISYSPRTFEEGKKIGWKDGFQALFTLIKYRFVN